jgi:hypothetical protein
VCRRYRRPCPAQTAPLDQAHEVNDFVAGLREGPAIDRPDDTGAEDQKAHRGQMLRAAVGADWTICAVLLRWWGRGSGTAGFAERARQSTMTNWGRPVSERGYSRPRRLTCYLGLKSS